VRTDLRRHPEYVLQQRHPDEDAVAGLPEVGGAGVGVDRDRDLVDAGQGVEEDRAGTEPGHRGGVDDVDAAGASYSSGVANRSFWIRVW
jgi:hypothetical protein